MVGILRGINELIEGRERARDKERQRDRKGHRPWLS